MKYIYINTPTAPTIGFTSPTIFHPKLQSAFPRPPAETFTLRMGMVCSMAAHKTWSFPKKGSGFWKKNALKKKWEFGVKQVLLDFHENLKRNGFGVNKYSFLWMNTWTKLIFGWMKKSWFTLMQIGICLGFKLKRTNPHEIWLYHWTNKRKHWVIKQRMWWSLRGYCTDTVDGWKLASSMCVSDSVKHGLIMTSLYPRLCRKKKQKKTSTVSILPRICWATYKGSEKTCKLRNQKLLLSIVLVGS